MSGLNVHSGEEVIEELSPSRTSALIGTYILGFITMFLGVGIFILVALEIYQAGTTYYITDKRVVKEFKFLVKKKTSIPYNQITDLSPSQGIVDRLTNSGSIVVQTAGSNSSEMELKFVKNPDRVEKQIHDQMNGEKEVEGQKDDAEKILKKRFAKGEIDKEEYEKRLEMVE